MSNNATIDVLAIRHTTTAANAILPSATSNTYGAESINLLAAAGGYLGGGSGSLVVGLTTAGTATETVTARATITIDKGDGTTTTATRVIAATLSADGTIVMTHADMFALLVAATSLGTSGTVSENRTRCITSLTLAIKSSISSSAVTATGDVYLIGV